MCEWGKLYWNFAVCPLLSTAVSLNQTEADKRRHIHEAHAYKHIVFSRQIMLSSSNTPEKRTNSEWETERLEGEWAETCVRIIAVI